MVVNPDHLGTVDRSGIEGTGSHGAGLCRWLTGRDLMVVEVDRPDRKLRRHRGKSDLIDAESTARKVLSGEAPAIPKAQDGNVEKIDLDAEIKQLSRQLDELVQATARRLVPAAVSAPTPPPPTEGTVHRHLSGLSRS